MEPQKPEPRIWAIVTIIVAIIGCLGLLGQGIIAILPDLVKQSTPPIVTQVPTLVQLITKTPEASINIPNTPTDVPSSEKSVTVYSDTSDGELVNLECKNWSSCRTALENVNIWDTNYEGTIGASWYSSGYEVKRVFLLFNTQSIPSNAVIKSATLNFYAGEYQEGNTVIHIVSSTASRPLSYTDFTNINFVSGGEVTVRSNRWTKIELNTNALDWISKDEYTTISLIHDYDIANSKPTVPNTVLISLSDDSQHRPYLVITYAIP